MVDLVVLAEKQTSVEEVNAALKKASEAAPLKGYLGYEDDELVSLDFRGDPRSSICGRAADPRGRRQLVKIFRWYDNEWGYSCRVRDLITFFGQQGTVATLSVAIYGCHG